MTLVPPMRRGWRAALALIAMGGLVTQPVLAQPASPTPAAGASSDDPGLYRPADKDERGLWMQMDEAERQMRINPTVIRDPALNAYVRGVLCKLTGPERCANVRLYIVRTPQFNASMAPNGMMEVWTGLLLRTRNEAQLAAVLGHEYTHFENRHSLKLWRDAREKSGAAMFLALTPYTALLSLAMVGSVFSFSRDMEREADAGGLERMARAGYDTREAAVVWEQLRAEMDATAEARKTRSRKDAGAGIFGTHPPSAERVAALSQAARTNPGVAGANGRAAYRAAMAAHWPGYVDDQLKLNDFGASEFLLAAIANGDWSAPLLYARGELYRHRAAPGDLDKAVDFYQQALKREGAPAESWRGLGLARLKLGREAEGKAALHQYLQLAPDAGDRAMMAMMAGEG